MLVASLLYLPLPDAHAASPLPSEQSLAEAIRVFNALARTPVPVPAETELKKLQNGEVVKQIASLDGTDRRRALGYMLTDVSRDNLWFATQDPHFSVQDATKDLLVSQSGPDAMEWYGYIDLPWPFDDRHWLVSIWNNHGLAQASGGKAWEHPWELVPNGAERIRPILSDGGLEGVSVEMMDEAVYIPYSKGAWVALEVEGHSLLIYHATASIGGNISDDIMLKFALSGMEKMFRGIESRGRDEVRGHWSPGHEDIYGGDGKAIRFD